MIAGFEDQTQPLTEYEEGILLPVFVKGLGTKIGKENAVKNKQIISALKPNYKIDEARVRKIINHIRIHGIVSGLIATSDGYYIATSETELAEYEQSLLGRESAIRAVRLSIHKQRLQMFKNELQTTLFEE